MSFIFFRLTTYYLRSMAIKDFFFSRVRLKWKFPSTSLSLSSDKRCSLSQIENGDFFAFPLCKKNEFAVYTKKCKKRKLYLPFSELRSDSKESQLSINISTHSSEYSQWREVRYTLSVRHFFVGNQANKNA